MKRAKGNYGIKKPHIRLVSSGFLVVYYVRPVNDHFLGYGYTVSEAYNIFIGKAK